MYLEQGQLEEVSHDHNFQFALCALIMSVSFLSAKAEANFKETLRAMMAAGVAQVSSY